MEYGIGEAEVEAAVAKPVRGRYAPLNRDRVEHFGFTADGRPLNVVTNRSGAVVITVVLQWEAIVLHAIQIRVDLEVGAGYVKYRPLGSGERIASTARLSEDVAVDFDATGRVLGIELISMLPEAFMTAQAYADQNGLAFPDLEGTSIAQLAHG